MAKKVLGRGLGAYFPDMQDKSGKTGKDIPVQQRVNTVVQVEVDAVALNQHQPRKDFDEHKLQELADSIKQHGLIQPVTVRFLAAEESGTGQEQLELISGERRLRAARLAGLKTLPAFIREANDEQMIIFGIIENIQREQLNPVEVALGYRRLMEECRLTQHEVAGRVGKNRSTITNTLRLLHLPPAIQHGLKSGLISAGHARALLSINDETQQEECYQKAVENQLSVRELEQLVQLLGRPAAAKKTAAAPKNREILPDIARQLGQRFSTGVKIRQKKKGGEINITYASQEELQRLLELFEHVDSSRNNA